MQQISSATYLGGMARVRRTIKIQQAENAPCWVLYWVGGGNGIVKYIGDEADGLSKVSASSEMTLTNQDDDSPASMVAPL